MQSPDILWETRFWVQHYKKLWDLGIGNLPLGLYQSFPQQEAGFIQQEPWIAPQHFGLHRAWHIAQNRAKLEPHYEHDHAPPLLAAEEKKPDGRCMLSNLAKIVKYAAIHHAPNHLYIARIDRQMWCQHATMLFQGVKLTCTTLQSLIIGAIIPVIKFKVLRLLIFNTLLKMCVLLSNICVQKSRNSHFVLPKVTITTYSYPHV